MKYFAELNTNKETGYFFDELNSLFCYSIEEIKKIQRVSISDKEIPHLRCTFFFGGGGNIKSIKNYSSKSLKKILLTNRIIKFS